MIYIGYYIGSNLYYKIMEGDSFKLTEFKDTHDELFFEFTTNKGKKFRDTLVKCYEGGVKKQYNEFHYFMILSDTDPSNNISIKNEERCDDYDKIESTWVPFAKALSNMLKPTISIMQKLSKQTATLDEIKKDF